MRAIVTLAMVKELRSVTGAGIMACKKALQTTNGNIKAAIRELRKAGEATVSKLAGKKTVEGVIVIAVSDDSKKGYIVEINCQTDFVARNKEFIAFAQNVAERGLTEKITDVVATPTLYQPSLSTTLEKARQELITKLGENIQIRRVRLLSVDSGIIGHYSHGSRIGVLVALNSDKDKLALAKDIAMHIAAFNPQAIRASDVPIETVEKEKEILIAQAKESGKSKDIITKIIDGRLNKFLKEISLEGQSFLKNPEILVGNLLKSEKVTITAFVRFKVGESIEQDSENFVNEFR
ncbi:translation elongation factor Ts [Coxiella endosymbiont of Dermacentor marginatus]|uniref:translation elongation factor Ts n=1 Tax=Coxiella endosymbiont of Dermacentor marginatus TaxID=1656159 RepID=UPI002222407B|nr:translation elongation factor Ts [Coxiella endosymbiont of Dermacentor marginatus]